MELNKVAQHRPLDIVVSSTSSDSHTWNLVFLQLVLEELGHRITNLGACVPDDMLIRECHRHRPGLIVISSVNGHGRTDGLRIIARLREDPELAAVPVVIGGMLGVAQGSAGHGRTDNHDLVAAGFDAVFDDGEGSVAAFRSFVDSLQNRTQLPPTRPRRETVPGRGALVQRERLVWSEASS